MPYLNCARCGLVNFTVAYWSNPDRCAGCGEPLPRPGAPLRASALAAPRPRARLKPAGRRGSAA